MAARALVDTSAWIEFYHPNGDPLVKAALADLLNTGRVFTVAPVIIELLVGARSRDQFELLLEDLKGLECIGLGAAEAAVAAELGWQLARRGRRVPVVDLLVAGAGVAAGAEVWHYGDEHFGLIALVGGPAERDLKAEASGAGRV